MEPFRPPNYSVKILDNVKLREVAKNMEAQTLANQIKCKDNVLPGFDARFPNMNQSRRCWYSYADYHRCLSRLGESEPRCEFFKKVYTAMCPDFWIERFDDLRENGSFPLPLD